MAARVFTAAGTRSLIESSFDFCFLSNSSVDGARASIGGGAAVCPVTGSSAAAACTAGSVTCSTAARSPGKEACAAAAGFHGAILQRGADGCRILGAAEAAGCSVTASPTSVTDCSVSSHLQCLFWFNPSYIVIFFFVLIAIRFSWDWD